jgi:hypothetical protein
MLKVVNGVRVLWVLGVMLCMLFRILETVEGELRLLDVDALCAGARCSASCKRSKLCSICWKPRTCGMCSMCWRCWR